MLSAQEAKIQKLGGGRYLSESVSQFPIGRLSALRIEGPSNLGGHIVVTADVVDSVRVDVAKIFKVSSEDTASAYDREVVVKLEASGSTLRLEVRTRRGAPWEGTQNSATADLTVTMPPDWDLEANGRFFEFDLTGPFRGASIKAEFGRIKLENVTDRVAIEGEHTAVELANVRGEIAVKTSYADLIIHGVGSTGSHPALFQNQFGAISVDNLTGAMVVETKYAPITISEVALSGPESVVRGSNSPVQLDVRQLGSTQLQVRNSNAPVAIRVPRSLSARLDLSVGVGGTIQTRLLDIQTHPDLMGAGRLEGICGSGNGLIDVDVGGPGKVEIEGK
ncbi:MAG: hypothetical protein HY304_05270 [candidate division Zixibacteria bacterium]|nr:hypothetical protein [candidate division Zixibacteria bacterium]